MKRILPLVALMVSIAGFAMEREAFYLVLTTAALGSMLFAQFHGGKRLPRGSARSSQDGQH
jgi:uncharacterized membrane protein